MTESNAHHDLRETLREIERRRLQLLVAANIADALPLHAPEFALVNPAGVVVSRDEYLGNLGSGALRYHTFEPVSVIAVEVSGSLAALRYQSHIHVTVEGVEVPLSRYWHTDVYVMRDDAWQVLWSQATHIAA